MRSRCSEANAANCLRSRIVRLFLCSRGDERISPMDAIVRSQQPTPFALKNDPCLTERVWPGQKTPVEAQKERKAAAGRTLTALGSYWKGRKPLILVNACVLGT